jgi:hypothetical protein
MLRTGLSCALVVLSLALTAAELAAHPRRGR